MDLQSVFYIVAIIFMLTVITFVMSAIIVVYYIKKRIFQVSKLASKPAEIFFDIGVGLFNKLGNNIINLFGSKKYKK